MGERCCFCERLSGRESVCEREVGCCWSVGSWTRVVEIEIPRWWEDSRG